jgi:hypothetical protein
MYTFVYNHVCFWEYVYLLDLISTYERKHVAFIFLILTYFTWRDILQFHPLTLRPHDVIFPYGKMDYIYIYIYKISQLYIYIISDYNLTIIYMYNLTFS